MTATDRSVALARAAVEGALDKKADDVVAIDVSAQLALTDVFVIATASNERQVGAIVDSVQEWLHREGAKPLRREGGREDRWVLLDFGDIVVRVQHRDEREFYQLERLWKDCPTLSLGRALQPVAGDAADATT